RIRFHMLQDGHRYGAVARVERNSTDALRGPPGKYPDIGNRKTDALAVIGGQQHVVIVSAGFNGKDAIAFLVELHGDLSVTLHVGEVGKLVAPYGAARRGEHDVKLVPFGFIGKRQNGGDAVPFLQRQHVAQELASGLRRSDRQTPDLFLVNDASRGEEPDRRVRIRNKQPGDEILVLRRHAGAALAAASLSPIGGKRHALYITFKGNRDDHVLTLDEVLVIHVRAGIGNLGAPRRAELIAHCGQLVLDDLLDSGTGRQDFKEIGNLGTDLVQLVGNFVTPERCQALKAQIEDGAGLLL